MLALQATYYGNFKGAGACSYQVCPPTLPLCQLAPARPRSHVLTPVLGPCMHWRQKHLSCSWLPVRSLWRGCAVWRRIRTPVDGQAGARRRDERAAVWRLRALRHVHRVPRHRPGLRRGPCACGRAAVRPGDRPVPRVRARCAPLAGTLGQAPPWNEGCLLCKSQFIPEPRNITPENPHSSA